MSAKNCTFLVIPVTKASVINIAKNLKISFFEYPSLLIVLKMTLMNGVLMKMEKNCSSIFVISDLISTLQKTAALSIEICEEKYNWIIERICSNLQYNIDTSEFPEEYPNPEEVYCTFREHCRTAQPLVEDVFKLPGVMHLLKSIRYQRNYDLFEQASEKIAHAQPDDIIFIDTLMDEEFVKIYSDFRTAQEEAIKKWFHYLSEFKKLRDLEQEEFKKTLPPEGEETINMLIQRSILSIDDLPVEKLSYRLTTRNNSMIKAIIEMIAIAPEIEPYLTSLEEIGNFSKRLSSEELYNKISAQLKKDNLNPF